ncbi:MAG: hypothetical protein JWN98_994 [Abditibacteriota bacterium]|nr:hypothetical protein [Abditibacteriota bacterium]
MESSAGANPFGALLGFWMLIQLVVVLGLLLGGLYALFCLHRMAANLDRLASSVEELVARQTPANVQSGSFAAALQQTPAPFAPFQSPSPAPATNPFGTTSQVDLNAPSNSPSDLNAPSNPPGEVRSS